MLQVADIMTERALTVPPGMTLRRAMAFLVTERITGAPVEDQGKVVGVISSCDLLMFAAAPLRRRHGAATRQPSRLCETPGNRLAKPNATSDGIVHVVRRHTGTDDTPSFMKPIDLSPSVLDEYTVAEAMTTTLHTISALADVTAAGRLMEDVGAHRLLVVHDNRLVGIVTTSDFTGAVAQGLLRDLAIVTDSNGGEDERSLGSRLDLSA
jgi:CBS domain-containing protein